MSDSRRAAAVDVGSTSVHLLVAELSEDRLETVLDLSELLGLGETVERTGLLGPIARGDLVRTLAAYAAEARRLGAASIAFAGTDPLRHAADAARACVEIERDSGVPVHVLDQDEEGSLTLLGATGGSVHGDVAVIDIGGGSTAATKRLDQAVTDGRLTKAQRDMIVADLKQRTTAIVNGTTPADGFGFRFRGHHGHDFSPGGPRDG